MKKYYELTFDSAVYYQYADEEKETVNKTMIEKDDIDQRFNRVFFEQLEDEDFAREIVTSRRVRINKEGKSPIIGLDYLELRNTTLKRCSKVSMLLKLKTLMKDSKLSEYSHLMHSFFVESSACLKSIDDEEASMNKKSEKEVEKKIRNIKERESQKELADIYRRNQKLLLKQCGK